MYEINKWRHVFKLDPNKEISDKDLEKVCESGTDAIIIGGTDGVTLDNVLHLMARVRRFTVPCVLEISNIESITPGFDYYFIPSVLNSPESKWVTGLHHQAIKEYGGLIDWDELIVEGYVILNETCKAAQLTKANTNLDIEDVAAYAAVAEHMLNMPIFYLEYSGEYGDIETVRRAKEELEDTTLFYGGGIRSINEAEEMAQVADVIVVGNIIYENIRTAVKTVHAVKR